MTTATGYEEFGVEVFLDERLEGVSDWDALIEAFRQAGFSVVQLPGAQDGFQEIDEHLQVTARCTGGGIQEKVWNILESHGGRPEGTCDIGPDEIDQARAEYPMLWAKRSLEERAEEIKKALGRLAAKGLIVDSGERCDGEIIWRNARDATSR